MKYFWFGVLVVGFLWGSRQFFFSPQQSWSLGEAAPVAHGDVPKAIDWEVLSQLDYTTGKIPDSLKALHGKMVKIPGFFVPLSDDFRKFDEFLLVPNAQACIHVPPPPPNLMVHVKLKEFVSIESLGNPLWVQGQLMIESTKSIYGAAGYRFVQASTELFDWATYEKHTTY